MLRSPAQFCMQQTFKATSLDGCTSSRAMLAALAHHRPANRTCCIRGVPRIYHNAFK